MRRAAALSLSLWLAGCGAEPEGIRWLSSRGANYALEPAAKLHVVSGFPTSDGVKVSGRETLLLAALIRTPDAGLKMSTEHGPTDTVYTHVWGRRSLSYAWERRDDTLKAEGRVFELSKGRLFIFTSGKDGAWTLSQVERTLEDLTPQIFEDGTGMDVLLGAFQEALGEDAPQLSFPQ